MKFTPSIGHVADDRIDALSMYRASHITPPTPSCSLLGRERDERKRARQVTSIQRTYRGVRGRRKACKQQVEVVELRRRRVAAAMMMQQRFRIHR